MSKAFTYPYECLKSTDYKTWQILTHTEANEKFARNYNFEEFTSIRYILNTTLSPRYTDDDMARRTWRTCNLKISLNSSNNLHELTRTQNLYK